MIDIDNYAFGKVIEERLVRTDWLALIVEHRPAVAYPAGALIVKVSPLWYP